MTTLNVITSIPIIPVGASASHRLAPLFQAMQTTPSTTTRRPAMR